MYGLSSNCCFNNAGLGSSASNFFIIVYVIPKDLSVSAIGMINSLLVRSNDELENIDLYSLGNDSRKDVALAFRELRKKKYIIYNALDDTYYIYVSPQK